MGNLTRATRIMWFAGTVLTALAMLGASASVAAQQLAHVPRARRAGADSSSAERRRASDFKGFRGIAAKLNTTPEALANGFDQARAADPKLSRGNFIAANVLADNLGARHPNITTVAMLNGLRSGKSVGQTLQSLGLSAAEANQARRGAAGEVKAADRHQRDADHRAQAESKAAEQDSRRAHGREKRNQ